MFIPDNVILYTCDVTSLYTCIPHDKGLDAISMQLTYDDNMKTENFILDCINFCLSHNYFWFGNKFYNQIAGTAMGVKFAPSYENLYMEHWELYYLYSGKKTL